MIMHEHLDMSQYQSKIVGQSSILALYGGNTKTAVKALMLFGLTCLIHQNASEFHEEHTGEGAHARGRWEDA